MSILCLLILCLLRANCAFEGQRTTTHLREVKQSDGAEEEDEAVNKVYAKDRRDRNDHSEDTDRVGERTKFYSLLATFSTMAVVMLFIFSLVAGHFYYQYLERRRRRRVRQRLVHLNVTTDSLSLTSLATLDSVRMRQRLMTLSEEGDGNGVTTPMNPLGHSPLCESNENNIDTKSRRHSLLGVLHNLNM